MKKLNLIDYYVKGICDKVWNTEKEMKIIFSEKFS